MGVDSQEHEPSVEEIRRVFRLVHACLDCWDHPDEWQAVLLEGVIEITGISAAVLHLVRPGPEPERPEFVPIASRGWKSPQAQRLYLESLIGEARPPMPNFDQTLGPGLAEGTVALSRPMVVPDELWYTSAFYEHFVKPTGLDEWASSFRIAPQLNTVVMLGGNSDLGAEPISMNRLKLLGILGEEIIPLLGSRLSLRGQISKAGLTPRQRQTLELLLDGLSEKQVAYKLGLSRATVHDYIVRLHRHFDVQSRGELLSYFIKRRPRNNG